MSKMLQFLKNFKASGRTDFPHFLDSLISFVEEQENPSLPSGEQLQEPVDDSE